MTTIRNTAIAAVAAITMAAAMASPAQAGSKHFWAGVGTAAAFGAFGAAHGHGYYGHDEYRGGRHYRRSARRCARRFGWHTWRWERCMRRRGY
ncbi:MAG: hypothetical protein ABJM26_19475 [Anderseniella sp.]